MTSYQERGFNNRDEEAKNAFDSFAQGITRGLAQAAERLETFDTDLDTGKETPLQHRLPFPGFEGTAVSKKTFLVGISNIEQTVHHSVLVDSPTNIVGVTLDRDDSTDPQQAPKLLVRIGQVEKDYLMTIQRVYSPDKIGTPSAIALSPEQLQTPIVKQEVFKLGAEKAKKGKRLGISGYHIASVSCFSMKSS